MNGVRISVALIMATSVFGQVQPSRIAFHGSLSASRFRMPSSVSATGSASLPGSDVIYSNSSSTPYFAPLGPADTAYDTGGLPSSTFPTGGLLRPGCATAYAITGLEFGYCTDQPTIDVSLSFYDHLLSTCAPVPVAPTAVRSFSGLPGSTDGTLTTWIVDLDLRSGAGGGPFTLQADGDGSWNGPYASDNMFGFGFAIPNPTSGQSGPLVAGVPNSSGYLGVRWSQSHVDYSEAGQGAYNGNRILIEPGDYCVDLSPVAVGLHLRLFADACGTVVGDPFCIGDGSGTLCPCGNSSPSLNREGCANSANGINGGRLEAIGTASLSSDSVLLRALRLPATTTALFYQGASRTNGGMGAVFGDGLRCVSGSIVRLAVRTASAGQVEYPHTGEVPLSIQGSVLTASVRDYQVWYRNNATFCTPATFNLTNGWEIAWQP